jgi:two-component system, NtrC family, response regulator AlgB
MAKLLVLDNEINVRQYLTHLLSGWGHEVSAVESGLETLERLSEGTEFDLVLSDWRIAQLNGHELLKSISEEHPHVVVVLLTAQCTVDNAVAILKDGAYDYITKPFSVDQIQNVLRRAIEVMELRSRNQALLRAIEGPLFESLSPSFTALIETARQLASNDSIILLTGESGTGKNVLAGQIHEWSPRRKFPFVTIDCRTLSENLLETGLFSHVKGSFARAIKDSPARFEASHSGTVLLDEIAELPLSLQTKVLRFLQDERFERVSGNRTVKVGSRIIVATNRDLAREVAAGQFRSDLYYRLNVVSLRIPALREHLADLIPLAEKLLAEVAVRNGRSGLHFSEEAKRALGAHTWPGNVRELHDVIERAVMLSRGNVINKEDLPYAISEPMTGQHIDVRSGATLRQIEEQHIRRVIAQTPSLEDAADALGIGSTTLWRKRKRYHIE